MCPDPGVVPEYLLRSGESLNDSEGLCCFNDCCVCPLTVVLPCSVERLVCLYDPETKAIPGCEAKAGHVSRVEAILKEL